MRSPSHTLIHFSQSLSRSRSLIFSQLALIFIIIANRRQYILSTHIHTFSISTFFTRHPDKSRKYVILRFVLPLSLPISLSVLHTLPLVRCEKHKHKKFKYYRISGISNSEDFPVGYIVYVPILWHCFHFQMSLWPFCCYGRRFNFN